MEGDRTSGGVVKTFRRDGTLIPSQRLADIELRGLNPTRATGDTIMGNMLHYAIVFLIVALVAAFLGFGGVAGTAMEGARILFWVAIVLFVISAIASFIRRA